MTETSTAINLEAASLEYKIARRLRWRSRGTPCRAASSLTRERLRRPVDTTAWRLAGAPKEKYLFCYAIGSKTC